MDKEMQARSRRARGVGFVWVVWFYRKNICGFLEKTLSLLVSSLIFNIALFQ